MPRKQTATKTVAKPNELAPRLKKDGTPWTPWSEQVRERLEKKAQQLAKTGEPEDRTGKCEAFTTGIHGPKRPCDRWAMEGQKVCYVHGGSTKAAKEAARRRFLSELDPSIEALVELRDQREHMPTALGAANQLINRVLGKVGESDKANTNTAPIIKIGVGIGGLPKTGLPTGQPPVAIAVQVQQPQLPSGDGDDEAAIEADVEDE